MRFSIHSKLSLVLIGFAACLLVATLFLVRWSFLSGFGDYIDGLEQRRLESLARDVGPLFDSGVWPGDIDERFRKLSVKRRPRRGPPPHARGERPRKPRPRGGPRRRSSPHPTALFDEAGQQIAGAKLTDVEHISVPVIVDDFVIGYVRSSPDRNVRGALEDAFSERQFQTSIVIGLIAIALAILLAAVVANRLISPLRRIMQAVSKLSSGDYEVSLDDKRNDELGQLISAVNTLARTLNETRSSRQRMFADISHELRTPLTVLTGELEALEDGIRPFDQNSLSSLSKEADRLKHLIDDLYALSVADVGALRYQFEKCELGGLVESAITTIENHDLDFEVSIEVERIEIDADHRRLDQLFRNLMSNAFAYTDAPGEIQIAVRQIDERAVVTISDSAPGVPDGAYENLFEPLYRVEESRNRRDGGAGLGLAICTQIVEAHHGSITAEPSPLGGLLVTVSLPMDLS